MGKRIRDKKRYIKNFLRWLILENFLRSEEDNIKIHKQELYRLLIPYKRTVISFNELRNLINEYYGQELIDYYSLYTIYKDEYLEVDDILQSLTKLALLVIHRKSLIFK